MKIMNLILISLSCLNFLSCTSPADQEKKKEYPGYKSEPNILWISCEDMSPRLGCYGDHVAQTPNLDRLAREGQRYTHVFTSAPVCAPCRAGIITGMYQTSIGAHHMRVSHRSPGLPTPYETVPPPYVKTFTEYLRAAGYFCTNNAKTDYQIGNPFTAWDECGPEAHYNHRPDTSKPFFAVFNIEITHERFTWDLPDSTDPASVVLPPYYPDIPEARNALARQYDNITIMDRQVGRILDELEASGYAENTVVFFWSDHGDGLPRAKRWPYESGTHIPLIIRWPQNVAPGSVEDRLISSVDLGPTVLSIAGIPIPVHMQGRPFLGDFTTEQNSFVVSARDRFDESYDMMRSLRTQRFRYVRNYYPNQPYVLYIPYRNNSPLMKALLNMHAEGTLKGIPAEWFASTRPPEELYDCLSDPHNIHNLAGSPKFQKELAGMRKQLENWMLTTGDLGKVSEEEMVENMWPGKIQPITERVSLIINYPGGPMQLLESQDFTCQGPAEIFLYCPTQGASMGYTFDNLQNANWKLYTGSIHLDLGEYIIRTKAIRYGYRESEVTGGTIKIR